MKHILFTGGGSAGHVVPNLAVMNALKYSHRITYMGTDGIEKDLVTQAGFPFFEIGCPKLRRSLTLKNLKIPFELRRAEKAALAVLKREKPDLVFSKGGYVSFPAVWAAHKLKIPVLTHESDLSPGLCTKLIARKCAYVLTSFPETAEKFKNGRYVGSPIRREILNGDRGRSLRKFGLSEKLPVLLVLGGGSGSKALNDAVRKNLSVLLRHMQILHLCGKGNLTDETAEGYIQREYERDMGAAFSAADVVLSRAGSNTVFEILALKKPAVLVPLAHASRGDQIENALYFERQGLVRKLNETELGSLPDAVLSALRDGALREALQKSAVVSGTDHVISVIKEVLRST